MEDGEEIETKKAVEDVCDKERAEGNNNRAETEALSRDTKSGSAVTPVEDSEPRYNRMKLFDKVMQKSIAKFMEHASFNRFASTFRPLYKKNPQRMESIHKQFLAELQKSVQEDISRLIEEGRLDIKLDELDKLEKAAQDHPEATWRPSGIPEQDFCSYLMSYYQKQEAYMQLELKKIRAENAALAQRVQAGRDGIAHTEQRISASVEEWKASVTEFEKLASSLSSADVFDV
ncbi:polyamine-modulated factor 1 [Gouania willdenowi]|uniref:Polyamine-modulated factor 1-like n=1 Tax=Gouania willdenowi TaxID=441366 RepID=A0A8C5HM06_GOUWI|nr:polyamine-modulated factor 1-like [Gouania willdenowi]